MASFIFKNYEKEINQLKANSSDSNLNSLPAPTLSNIKYFLSLKFLTFLGS